MGVLFRIKQYFKMYIQNKYLPRIYEKAVSKTEVDKDKIIFADMHSEGIPYSMQTVYEALLRQGKKPLNYCADIGKMSALGGIKYMKNFMKDYASAGTVYICSYFLPVSSCKKRSETKVVQLWHSGGLMKKMGYDTSDDIPEYYKGNVTANYDLVTVSAPVCVPVWEKALRLPQGITKPLGIARTDLMYDEKWLAESKKLFKEAYPEAEGKKVVLYAPTFSGNAAHPECPGLDAGLELLFEKEFPEYFLIIRPHPHMRGKYPEYFDDRFSKISTERLLQETDILITDYSSILFDYSIFRKPFVLFCPDLSKYSEERGLYVDVKTFPATVAENASELATAIREEKWGDKEELEKFFQKYMGACDGHVTERILC